eukprot:585304-Rhodomonas_salina.2
MARGSDGVMVAAVATPWQTMASAFEFGVTSCEPGGLGSVPIGKLYSSAEPAQTPTTNPEGAGPGTCKESPLLARREMKDPREEDETAQSNKTAKTADAAETTVVSSPGKVMIAGGYVVLEQPNVSCVAAVSARVYVTASGGDVSDSVNGPWEVRVVSGQMGETRMYQLTFGETASIERLDEMPANPYAEAALLNAFAVARHLKGQFC